MNILKLYLYRIISGIRYIYYTIFTKNLFKINVNKWFLLDWDKNFLINHKLNASSIVFEVWGYIWVFTDKIINKYNCTIYVFEPVEEFYNILLNKYKNNPKIKVFHFWLSNKNQIIKISKSDDWSSVFKNSNKSELIKLIDINDFIIKEHLENKKIDLISINIEWGEYGLIDRILTLYPNIFSAFQVQFHDFVEKAPQKRLDIINLLYKHNYRKGYSFPFVWEFFNK